MPLMRYWTNDITHLFYDNDSKRTHIKMGPIKGRSDDMLIIRGVNLFHTQVEEVLMEVDLLSTNYQLVVTRDDNLDEVKIRVEFNEDVYDEIEFNSENDLVRTSQKQLQKMIKDRVGLNMSVCVVDHGEVPRSVGGKLSRVDDQRSIK